MDMWARIVQVRSCIICTIFHKRVWFLRYFENSREQVFLRYSRSSRKRPPREFRKVVSTRAGRLREFALVSDHVMKQLRVVAYKSF